MKKLLVLLCMSVSVMGFSQEWGGVDKNTVTMKEVAPTWPGCESKSGAGTDACFKQKLAQHIGKNFKYPAEAWKNISGGTASLQEEAKRNIMLIPKMKKPGMLAGKPKAIKYTVPFDFKTGK